MKIQIETTCPYCLKKHTVIVEEQDYRDFIYKKKLCQEAFPYLGRVEREMLISGICGECWEKMWSEPED